MIDDLKEEMNESLTEISKNTSKQQKRINKPRRESENRINKENTNWRKTEEEKR